MTNYPVGDFLIRIKNAALAKNRKVVVRKTKFIKSVALSLKEGGYLDEVEEENGNISARLAYKRKEPVLIDIKLVSKPGLRIYMGVDELEKIKGPSTYIISTPKGVFTSKEVLKKRIGGEVIAKIT